MNGLYLKHLAKLMFTTSKGSSFWNYRLYKKFESDQIARGTFKLEGSYSFAIVLQGQIVLDSNFTVETLKIYRKNFPNAILILSTWSIPNIQKKELKAINVYVIENQKPANPGIGNINLQIVSSRSGILEAQKQGALYVLKTRCDQRIYHPGFDAYLFNLIHYFPLGKEVSLQKKRLIGASLNCMKFRLYGVSDMFLFGCIDDMVMYWDTPLDERLHSPETQNNTAISWREHAMLRICEVYLCIEFIKKLGREIRYTLSDSFDVLSKHFLIIDKDAIKIYWHKYTLNADRYPAFGLYEPELGFNDWLMLFSLSDQVLIDESILDQPMALLSR